jgi:hypothetical protein
MMKRSHRLLILLLTLLISAILFLIQSRMEQSESPVQSTINCKAVRQCLGAGYAWPPKMDSCPALLSPITARFRVENGKWGYMVAHEGCISSQTLVAPKYDVADKFEQNGLAKVSLDGKWGYVNLKGEESIPLNYDEVGDFDYGLVPVRLSGKWSYLDARGGVIGVGALFDAVSAVWRNGLSAVQVNGKWGYISPQGNIEIDTHFDSAENFQTLRKGHLPEEDINLAKVELNGKWGVIDKKGNVVVPIHFDAVFYVPPAHPTDPPFLLVALNRRYGFFNHKGTEIIPLRLVKPVGLRYDNNNFIQAHLNETTLVPVGSGQDSGQKSLPLKSGWFYLDFPNEKLRFDEHGKAQFWRNGEWFSIDDQGRLVK